MTSTATDLMTADQFFDWVNSPERGGRLYELERGRVVEVPRPGKRHGIVCVNVGYILASYIRRRRRGHACGNDTGVIWENDPYVVRGPDVIFYDENCSYRDSSPRFTDEIPTLIVEVLSPTDRFNRVTQRINQFLTWGVRLAWVIDPEDRTVSVFRPGQPPDVLDATQELTGGDVLPDFRCPVADFFYSAADESTPA